MQEHLKALVVILLLATIAFALCKLPASQVIEPRLFKLRRNLWYFLTFAAFISHSYVTFACIVVIALAVTQRRDSNPLALFFSLLFLAPPAPYQVPGFGVVNYILSLDYIRLLTIVILVPAAVRLKSQSETKPVGAGVPDKLLALYLLLAGGLGFRDTSITDGMRHLVYLIVDVFIPYYVASRSVRNVTAFKNVFFALLVSTLILSLIAIVEYSRNWLLYRALIDSLELRWGLGNYLGRTDSLRASASTGQAIVLGYLVVVAIGTLSFLSRFIENKKRTWVLAAVLTAGLFATLSRGPWIGAGVVVVSYLAISPGAVRKLSILFVAMLLSLPLISVLPGGEKLLDLLPFMGSVEKENIDYRQRLIDNSIAVIERHPWFGSNDYLGTAEMEGMRQGQGIIDVVNTYIGIALEYGGVGLTIFCLFFANILSSIFRGKKKIPELDQDTEILGRALISILIAILVIIFTVSSISFIPVIYWSIAGLGVAYVRMIQLRSLSANA